MFNSKFFEEDPEEENNIFKPVELPHFQIGRRKAAGGMKPAAVDAAVKRLEKRSSADRALRSSIRKLINRIDSANIES